MSIERKYASYLLKYKRYNCIRKYIFYFNILTWGKFAVTIINNLQTIVQGGHKYMLTGFKNAVEVDFTLEENKKKIEEA